MTIQERIKFIRKDVSRGARMANADDVNSLMWLLRLAEKHYSPTWEKLTPAQERLRRKHGTPAEFSLACSRAIGDISVAEANAAVRNYLREWADAGRVKPKPRAPKDSALRAYWDH